MRLCREDQQSLTFAEIVFTIVSLELVVRISKLQNRNTTNIYKKKQKNMPCGIDYKQINNDLEFVSS